MFREFIFEKGPAENHDVYKLLYGVLVKKIRAKLIFSKQSTFMKIADFNAKSQS